MERFFPFFRAGYAAHYAERYDPWRPVIAQTVHDYLACGDLQHGFSRVRCPRCRHEFFVAIERLVQYMSRCPFSLERFVNISPDGHVFYRTENAECRPFAYENEDGETPHSVKRNFQPFKPLDFIADPELFYIADGDGQGFRDDDSQQASPDYD